MTETSQPQAPRPTSSLRSEAGMTMIELMATMAIVGSLASIAVPKYHEITDAARVARAIGDIQAIQSTLDTRDTLPDVLATAGISLRDPWGQPYVYVKFATGGVPRTDRFGVPVNNTYDVYSLGRDGATSGSLNAGPSLDDVVRASDGGWIGAASRF